MAFGDARATMRAPHRLVSAPTRCDCLPPRAAAAAAAAARPRGGAEAAPPHLARGAHEDRARARATPKTAAAAGSRNIAFGGSGTKGATAGVSARCFWYCGFVPHFLKLTLCIAGMPETWMSR
jgi:hypothetical protein